MNKRSSINSLLLFGLFILLVQTSFSQDSLLFKGSCRDGSTSIRMLIFRLCRLRYIPTLNYQVKQKHDNLIDFEVSANINGAGGFHPFDTGYADGKIKPYRVWARYSSRQFEIRLGLQKINFGSATMLRPLMWFDQLDPAIHCSLQMAFGAYWAGITF